MSSIALQMWQSRAQRALDERGRRYATRQINHACVVLLCSHFQRFCRDLHEEAADFLMSQPSFAPVNAILYTRLTEGRKLNSGNANPGNIGSDFGRFGLDFWSAVRRRARHNASRQKKLADLNLWRNAVAHQDFGGAGRVFVRAEDVTPAE